MTFEPEDLGARLLEVEPVNAARRQRLEQEVRAVFEHQLSRVSRVYWSLSLVAAGAFAALGATVLARGRGMDAFLQVIWWVYTLANVGWLVLAAHVLRRGKFDARQLIGWAKLSPALTLVIALLLFVRALQNPTIEAVLWVAFGIVCLLVALASAVYNRVVTAELSQRELMLKLELRIADLMEQRRGA